MMMDVKLPDQDGLAILRQPARARGPGEVTAATSLRRPARSRRWKPGYDYAKQHRDRRPARLH